MSASFPLSRKYSPIAHAPNGARYWSVAGSEAPAITTMVCSIAPCSSRVATIFATDECFPDRCLDDPTGRANLAALDDAGVVAKDDRAHRVFLEVERKAEDIVAEVEELGGHAVGEPVDARDAVSDLDHGADVDRLGS